MAIKRKKEDANGGCHGDDDGVNDDSDGDHARRAGKRARVAVEIRSLTCLLRGACRIWGGPRS